MYQIDPDDPSQSRFGSAYGADRWRKMGMRQAGLESGARVKAAGENHATVGPYNPSGGETYRMAGDLLGRAIGGFSGRSTSQPWYEATNFAPYGSLGADLNPWGSSLDFNLSGVTGSFNPRATAFSGF